MLECQFHSCAHVSNLSSRQSSQFYNTQRTWQLLWWGCNVWCFIITEAICRANWKLPNADIRPDNFWLSNFAMFHSCMLHWVFLIPLLFCFVSICFVRLMLLPLLLHLPTSMVYSDVIMAIFFAKFHRVKQATFIILKKLYIYGIYLIFLKLQLQYLFSDILKVDWQILAQKYV